MLKLWRAVNTYILKNMNVFIILSAIILLLVDDGPPTGT